jgi:hypothetical protein
MQVEPQCKRVALGNHSYTSADVFHAVSYADLTEADELTFLVVEMHVGPMALGKQDQVFATCCQVCIVELSQLLCGQYV